MTERFPKDLPAKLALQEEARVVALLVPPLRALVHDLRSPLGAVSLDLATLRRLRGALPETERVVLEDILDNLAGASRRLTAIAQAVYDATEQWIGEEE